MPTHEPNFANILHSDLWQSEIVPLLDGMIAYQVKLLSTADLPEVKQIQGRLQALQALRETPQDEIDFERTMRNRMAKQGLMEPDTEEREDGHGRGRSLWGRDWLRRNRRNR